jgi:hypothetical protein
MRGIFRASSSIVSTARALRDWTRHKIDLAKLYLSSFLS